MSTISDTNNNENPHREPNWPSYIAPCLILLAPLIAFIDYHGHPFVNPEVWWLILGMIIVGLVIGSFIKNMGNFCRSLSLAILLEFSLELIGNFDDIGKVLCAILAFLFAWFFREKASKILVFTFSIFIISTLILPSDRLKPILKEYDVASNSSLPPVIHLILDGHIGVEGIPIRIKGGQELKDDIKSFYAKNGFLLYGNAYSHFSITLNSIPSLLNFNAEIEVDKSYAKEISTDFEYEILSNKYFQEMSDLGYEIKVYQSKYLDYCQENFKISSCYTYQIFSTKFLEDLSASLSSKVWVLASSFLFRSDIFEFAKKSYWHLTNYLKSSFGLELPFPWNWDGQRTNSISALETFDILSKDIQKSPEGNLFFAHLIVPHDPFVYDSNCQLYKDPIREWELRGDPTFQKRLNTRSSWEKRYKKYLRQTSCVTQKLHEVFDEMKKANIYDKSTIIIHGDHGSGVRIRRPILANQNELTPEDIVDSFSTIFAVKFPNGEADYDLNTQSLNQIFSKVSGKMFSKDISTSQESPYVNLRIRDASEKKKRSFVRWPYPEIKN
jgi:hypothetical protein